ncbi:MAG TPA: 4a-hydroxytetrahydrobiopterin dehydratase [Nitrososphaerales archaeon]
MSLAFKKCVPCEGGTLPLSREEAEKYLKEVQGWSLIDNKIEKEFKFPSYLNGLEFAYNVGKIAEQEGHHPDILIRWRRVRLALTTHAIKGLSENDFIIAAKAEQEYVRFSS